MARNIMRVCFLLSICVLFAGASVNAQTDPVNSELINGYGLRNLSNAIIIRASPATPNAGDSVHFTVEGALFDLQKDTISWNINGKNVASGAGIDSVDAVVDQKADSLTVLVTVDDPIWGLASSEATIIPLQVDILYDAPTYVPPFYRGRTLPSAGGVVHLQALARLTKNGTPIPTSSITYTWSRNGKVLGNISGLGKSEISIDSTHLYGKDTISVRASAGDDTLSASASIVIPDTKMTVRLYEDHPLYGITYFNALAGRVSSANEITVAAIPYFATATGLNDPTLEFNWSLNDAAVTASSTKRNELTVDSSNDVARLHLDTTSARNFFMSDSSDWQFKFGNSGGSTINKPGANDAFHSSNI